MTTRGYYSRGTRPADRDTSHLPKWAQDRLRYAEAGAKASAEYWEKRVAEAMEGKGPYTFKLDETDFGMPREIRCRLMEDETLEIMSSYGGGLIIYPQVTNVIRVAVEKR